jgi:class 3 adenylate cyclase/pimeloyl-ACP methyl ester carboxylesterase
MPETQPERRLVAILFTDMVGYTALMGTDERAAIATVEHSRALIGERVEAHGGNALEHEGDGTLSTFPSAVEAVSAALEIQDAAGAEEIALRIGIHVGDVMESETRVVGDGVNVASRVCALANAGEIFVSETVYDQVRNRPELVATRIGPQQLKNVNREVVVWRLTEESGDAAGAGASAPAAALARWRSRSGRPTLLALALVTVAALTLGFDAELRNTLAARAVVGLGLGQPDLDREIGFTTSKDGTRIAWASVGQGSPVVQVQVWATHLEYGPLGPPDALSDFLERHRVIYYDGRGFGLSQRGVEHSYERRIEDLEAVIAAAGLDRFAMWGISAGTAVAVGYVAQNPERVTKLVLYGSVLRQPLDDETFLATEALIRGHWGSEEAVFRDYFRGLLAPDVTDFQMAVFEQFLGQNGTAEDAAEFWKSAIGGDVRPLAAQITTPTLLQHRREDVLVSLELGLEAASLIPDSQLVTFSGRNHVFMPGEAEGRRSIESIEEFLSQP